LKGIWREEYIFLLQQAYDAYMFYQSQIKLCDDKIKEILLSQAAKVLEEDITNLGVTLKKVQKKQNKFCCTIHVKCDCWS